MDSSSQPSSAWAARPSGESAAKLETGSVHYEITDIRVREMLVGAEGLVSPQVWAKGLTLHVVECPLELTVRAMVKSCGRSW